MNRRLFFSIMVLACLLPLAPTALLAQAKEEAKSAPAAGRGRQAITNKLDRIRIDSVSYDNLPLFEIVRDLINQSRKRDPEGKGVNFLMNPNASPGDAPGAAHEQVDVNSIAVKIIPPLTDVRLVDVLDAVVKVADRPIQYSIEDYGVVFSMKGVELAANQEVGFVFPGGSLREFLDAVQAQYKVDWVSVVDLPNEMRDVRIPRLRINQDSLGSSLQHPASGENEPLAALITLYNQLGEQKPELGRLIVKGNLAKPSVVMFVPDKAMMDMQPKIKVKAFSIYGIGDVEREKLRMDIDKTRAEAMHYADSVRQRGIHGPGYLDGTVAIHQETSLLVATGPEPFVEMVESIVNACQAKGQAKRGEAPVHPARPENNPPAQYAAAR